MIKKILSFLLVASIFNFISMPAFAAKSEVIDAEYHTELDVNKASKNQVVQFITTEDYKDNDLFIPKGTIFSGNIKSLKKGRWGYRRAKARVKINKMILPTGESYEISAQTKRAVLKGSAVKNVAKGIITFPVVIVTGATGTCVILVEAISIAGILLIGPTSYLIGETMGKLSHGINYKKQPGDAIQLKIYSIENH